jgi:hypothetical protein
MDDGREIDWSDEHPAHAYRPRVETLEPDSNVKFTRFVQSLKHFIEIASTDAGMHIA